MHQLSDISKAIKALIWPQRCMFCTDLIFDNDNLTCKRCTEALPYITGEKCQMCGCEKADCSCSSQILYYDKIAAPFYYDGVAKQCITSFKFLSKKHYANAIAQYLYQEMINSYSGERFDLITCVPLYKKDKRRRGFNQSELIAQKLSEMTGIPLKADILKKLYKTNSQASQTMINRSGNVFGAYEVADGISLDDCTVLLIDDIKTTGSTLSECGKMLYLAGAAKVCCLCFCVARFKKKERKKGQ